MRYIAFASVVGLSFAVFAQDGSLADLERVRSFRCVFDRGAQATWDGERLSIEGASYGDGGEVTFESA